MTVLHLSPYVLPVLRQGLHPLTPQNMTDGGDRLRYAKVVIDKVTRLVERGHIEAAHTLIAEVPFGNSLVRIATVDGVAQVISTPELANWLGHQPDDVGILLRDGRTRSDDAMAYLPTGVDTAAVLGLLRHLHRGIERDRLLALAERADVGFEAALLDDLIGRAIVEPGPAAPLIAMAQPSIAWMGHAFVIAAAGGKQIWIDPFPAPRCRWSQAELATMFRSDLPDAFLLDDYGPSAHHVTQDELATPDAIFITHQDPDHMHLGALGLVPPEVPIYVPRTPPAAPWLVDLPTITRQLIGSDRNVITFDHGDSVSIGDDLRVTALPFIGEFPHHLPHRWNTYYLELPNQTWALFADSALTGEQVDALVGRRRGDPRPFGVMGNLVYDGPPETSGYRDVGNELTNAARLYSWYTAPIDLFAPAKTVGLPVAQLRRLVADAKLSFVYPYAHGNLPWYRIEGSFLSASHVGSHTGAAFHTFERLVAELGASVVRLRHARPFPER